jgi:ferric-dicitrate binding protein FerR (iron transport regulator)
MKENIDRIIWQVVSGKASPEQELILQEWIEKSEQNKQVYDVICKIWASRSREPKLVNEDETFDRIWQKANSVQQIHSRLRLGHLLKIAATFLIIVTAGFLVYQLGQRNIDATETDTPQWVYKENPAGQKSKLFLPDGTEVWLNAESKLEYLENFSDSIRLVLLSGEAFFEVTHDSLRPFQVQTGKIVTQVIGTSFNINAFPENNNISVNLVSGKVKVQNNNNQQSVHLDPGEAVRIDLQTQQLTSYLFDELAATGWRNGLLQFTEAGSSEIINRLARWYGVSIAVEGTPPADWQFSGAFENESLKNVLEVMQYSRDFRFELKNKNLKIIF